MALAAALGVQTNEIICATLYAFRSAAGCGGWVDRIRVVDFPACRCMWLHVTQLRTMYSAGQNLRLLSQSEAFTAPATT